MVQAGATLTIYASTTHPTYFRPASLGCVLWTRLDSQTGMRVAAIALLRTGWADIFNRVEQGPYAGGAQLSEGIVVHIVR